MHHRYLLTRRPCEISAAREYDGVSLVALAPEWEEKCLKTSMAYSTMERPVNMCVIWIMLAELPTLPAIKKNRHGLAPRRDPKQRFFFTDRCTCLQNLGTDQQTPHGTNHSDDL